MGREQMDVISNMRPHQYGGAGMIFESNGSGHPEAGTIFDDYSGMRAWKSIIDNAPDWSASENFRAGEEIQTIRSAIYITANELGIDLEACLKNNLLVPEPLVEQFQALHEKANALAYHNIRLLYKAVSKIERFGDLSDDMQSIAMSYGWGALVTAAMKYDPWYENPEHDARRRYRYSSLAVKSATRAMIRGMKDQNIIHIPIYMQVNIARYYAVREHLDQLYSDGVTNEFVLQVTLFSLDLKGMPSEAQIAELLTNNREVYKGPRMKSLQLGINADVISSLDEEHVVQMDDSAGDGTGEYSVLPVENVAAGESFEAQEKIQQEMRVVVAEALARLPPREQEVLELRYGFHDGKEYTLEEVGRYFGISIDRVRQIEVKALRKLRHPTRTDR